MMHQSGLLVKNHHGAALFRKWLPLWQSFGRWCARPGKVEPSLTHLCFKLFGIFAGTVFFRQLLVNLGVTPCIFIVVLRPGSVHNFREGFPFRTVVANEERYIATARHPDWLLRQETAIDNRLPH